MPKLGAGLPLPSDEAIEEGKTYTITEVETFTSDVQGYKGVRVTLDAKIALALWLRDVVGRSSKLGAFIVALGDDTDKWAEKRIKVIAWQEKDRYIEVA